MGLLTLLFDTGPKLVIGEIQIDVSLSESHESSMDVTDNPVEEGANISDHIQPKPRSVTIEGIHSDTPISFLNGFDPTLDLGGTSLSATRAKSAYQALIDLQKSRDTFTLDTGLTSYDDVVCERLIVPRDAQTGRAFKFSAVFREIRIVETETLAISTNLFAQQSVGKVSTQTPSAPASSNATIARSIFNGIRSFAGGG